jgi:serine protease
MRQSVRNTFGVVALGVALGLGGTAGALAQECDVTLAAEGVGGRELVPGAALPRIIVKFREGAERSDLTVMTTMPGLARVTQPEAAEPTPPGVQVFEIDMPFGINSAESAARVTSTLDLLRENPDVEYAHLDGIVVAHAAPVDDPCYALQWHYWPHGTGDLQSNGGIDLPAAWPTNTGSADVVVAVIDTGLVASHPDFNGANIIPGWDFIDNDPDATDAGPNNGFHGTHVAGTIGVLGTNNGGGAASANWNVKIQPVRALDGEGSGSFLGIANAITWAAGGTLSDGNTNPTPAKVINMSLGGRLQCLPNNAGAIIDAINFAASQGVVVVVSAGNDNASASGSTPASCPNTLTVAATDFAGQRSWFSNFGDMVDIAAPGGSTDDDLNGDGNPDGVLSSVNTGYAFYQGTSMAAPHVAGVAALVFANHPGASAQQVTDMILKAATPTSCDLPCGVGLLNAAAAK